MILCRTYKSGHRSDVSAPPRCALAAASARKRKAAAIQHPDEVPNRACQRRQQKKATEEDQEAMLFAQRLESEMQRMSEEDDDAMLFARILESEMDLLRDHEAEHVPGGEVHAAPEQSPPADDDDEVMEISLDEFLGSSAPRAAPPCTAAQQENAVVSCVQTSQHDQSTTESDVIKAIPEKLMSAPSPLTDDDDDDDDMCGLACPPMDDNYVELMLSEPLVQFFDQALVGEFISDI